ncbi:MAG: alanine--tRNA ligase, partial [Bacteroidales bacterium]|nr:alanine--tRNA ligase [Bacteroidales bacterium]
RVVADHLRAVAFSIADGQLPSNNKAGYVIRRILRRAVRYGYNHLGIEEPFIHKLVPVLAASMGDVYPELRNSSEQISKIIYEEESAFLRTLGKGLKMIEKMIADLKGEGKNILPGKIAFELYDTFGFPADLTQLILKENDMHIDMSGFEKEMKNQKERSREDAVVDTGDWVVVRDTEGTVFTGYDTTVDQVNITRYRKIKIKGRHSYQIVLDKTPFYAESGGQVGDTGTLTSGDGKITVLDTLKENNQILHITDRMVSDPSATLSASVDTEKRQMTASNHTATHLLHYALRSVLGTHVEQKGSLVTPDRLRFDFSHFGKPDREELRKIEELANSLVREGSSRIVNDGISMEEAHKMGAMALFGEKYGERVRVISFGRSVELCGGTHVENTGSIGIIKIISEGAIAAGVRRIEAITAARAEEYISEKLAALDDIAALLKSTGKVTDSVEKLIAENSSLRKTIEKMEADAAVLKADELKNSAEDINGIKFISSVVEGASPEIIRHIAFRIRNLEGNYVAVLGSSSGEKASLTVLVSDSLIKERGLSAVNIIKEISSEINGGGGGQPFLATAGGKKAAGLPAALQKAREILLR